MNHQLFENWLLSEEPLPAEQAQTLREHLRTCEKCNRLQASWIGMHQLIRSTPEVAPAPGFTARWQERLMEQRRAAHQRQSFALLLSMAGAAVVLFVLISFQALHLLRSPDQLLLIGLYRLTSLFVYADTTRDVVGAFLNALTQFMPSTAWVFIAGTISMISVLWIVVYQQLTSPRRIKL